MFPWSPEFAWDVSHVVFFGALYAVLGAIAASLAVAVRRARRDAREGLVDEIAWRADFAELPAAARACRHQLTGEAPGRVCESGFDCRGCRAHREYGAARRAPGPARVPAGVGFGLPLDRCYHRGHTWARPEADGTVTVGLDEVGARLVGPGAGVVLPAAGVHVRENGTLARVRSRGREARLLSPVDGTVIGAWRQDARFTVRVDPGPVLDLRHLLSGEEAKVWALRELERLQAACGPLSAVALADGGELVEDVGAAVPDARFDALLGDVFLEP